ncbi:MAG: helix-turn-helix domain-containing protein [Candidatus Woesearchaeota archaeon]
MVKLEAIMKALGLNAYEIKAYVELLKHDAVTGYQLGRLSSVPQGRIYDILDSLVLRGLAAVEVGKPKRFRAIPPRIGLSALLIQKDERWEGTKNQVKALIDQLDKRKFKAEPVSVIQSKDAIYLKILDLYRIAQKEMLGIARGLSAMKISGFTEEVRKSIDRGVVTKLIVTERISNRRRIDKLMSLGVEVRHFPMEELRFNITDEKMCLIGIDTPNAINKRTTIVIENAAFCRGMRELYLSLWEKAEDV